MYAISVIGEYSTNVGPLRRSKCRIFKLFLAFHGGRDLKSIIFCILQGKEAGIRTLVALDDQGGK